MPNPASPRRRNPGAGMKILITASALAATVAGWASLTLSQAAGAAALNPTPTSDPLAGLPALPTIVPAPDLSKITASSSAAPSLSPSAPVVIRKVGAPSSGGGASRSSSAPGAVTTTRSSHP